MSDPLLERFCQGDRLALSWLLTRVARGQAGEDLWRSLPPARKASRVVAITGSGGVGKSSLAGRLIDYLRELGLTVAVLACDPQSPLSGGALLGDRFRMPNRPADDGVFIRSLAAAGGQGAVARHLDGMIRLFEIFGFDIILVETVGAGQGDTAVYDLADVVVLLVQPETGDDLQWEKAGLLEIADVVAIHKADLPGAEAVEGQVRSSLDLAGAKSVPVVLVSAREGTGIEPLWHAIAACPLRRGQLAASGRHLFRLTQETLASRFADALASRDVGLTRLLADWQQGILSQPAAVEALLHFLAHSPRQKPEI
jgi:LAO/AO transport system ATPase